MLWFGTLNTWAQHIVSLCVRTLPCLNPHEYTIWLYRLTEPHPCCTTHLPFATGAIPSSQQRNLSVKIVKLRAQKPVLMPIIALAFALSIVAALSLGAVSYSRVQARPLPLAQPDAPHKAATPAEVQVINQPVGRPLASLLNSDGTLNLDTGYRGNLDPSGWQVVAQPGAQPRFVRADQGCGTGGVGPGQEAARPCC